MADTITRIYDSEDRARRAAAEAQKRVAPAQVTIVTPSDGEPAAAKLTATGMSEKSAQRFAEAVERGHSVVAVTPSDGSTADVNAALDSIDSVDAPTAAAPDRQQTERRMTDRNTDRHAAPLSSLFGWTVLLDDPTPLSRKFGWRVLLNDPTPLSSKIGWRTLSSNQRGKAELSNDPAPLSRLLGWPLLLNNATPVSDRFGWRALKDDPTPASSKFGWPTLSDGPESRTSLVNDPAPLSSLFGLPVLLRDRPCLLYTSPSPRD